MSYDLLTSAFEAAGMQYQPACAAMFCWLDLRAVLSHPTFEAERLLWREILDSCKIVITPGEITIMTGAMGITPGEITIMTGAMGITPGEITIMTGAMGITPGEISIMTGAMGITPGAMGITPFQVRWASLPFRCDGHHSLSGAMGITPFQVRWASLPFRCDGHHSLSGAMDDLYRSRPPSSHDELSVACARLAAFWKKKVAERAADGQGGNGQEENGPGVAGQAENGQGDVAEGNGESEEGEEKQGEGGEKGQGAVGGEGSLSRKRKAEDDPGDA
ncbi:unnamed protein product [Closterium sp. NIES-54]